MGLDTKTYWLTVRQSQCDFDFGFGSPTLAGWLPALSYCSAVLWSAMGPSGARCQEWPCWLVAGSKLMLCSNSSDDQCLTSERRNNERRKKQKSWHWTNILPWVPEGLDAKSDRVGWLPAVSYCSALLCLDQFSSWEYKDENGKCPWWIVKISWVQIRIEQYRMIEDEISRRFHSDISASFCVEIRCQETTSEDWESYCMCNGEWRVYRIAITS
jgi:hypothetical protein